jgi:hypothetical protein
MTIKEVHVLLYKDGAYVPTMPLRQLLTALEDGGYYHSGVRDSSDSCIRWINARVAEKRAGWDVYLTVRMGRANYCAEMKRNSVATVVSVEDLLGYLGVSQGGYNDG